MFLVNSRLGHFSAPASPRDPFSRSYGVNLPSSLAMNRSSTLGFSPRPPVSVYGTGRHAICCGGFLVSMITLAIRSPEGSRYCHVSANPDINRTYTYALQPSIPSDGGGATPQSLPHSHNGYRNLDRLSITCPFRVRLRARLTLRRLTSLRKPWAFGVRVSRPHCRYLCLHFLFRTLQPASRLTFGADRNAPLPLILRRVHSFGSMLDARLSSTQLRSTSELLRTL